ncbi:sulfurtransferase TusA family protein [Rhodopseudomonas sp. HC1]|uniref:sulfurtransferase TusA family protein n=1 Tax=Rhodopseudomonas infernalis TaxID=2897386 RepID=UPI001EE90919|nr:sulfurtransferase TusA family protein [Rhodopseudomonas infernalis]MCG6203805.1 sulfurtransferase TusA family protein [Rhodopseudomonas infernalis]
MTMIVLDLTGLKCPLPALKTRKALAQLDVGARLEVRCTDPMSLVDIPVLIQQTGDRLESTARNDAVIAFVIEKMPAKDEGPSPATNID